MLRRLSEAMGVSGSEKEIRRILRELAAPYGETWTDAMGTSMSTKRARGKKSWSARIWMKWACL